MAKIEKLKSELEAQKHDASKLSELEVLLVSSWISLRSRV